MVAFRPFSTPDFPKGMAATQTEAMPTPEDGFILATPAARRLAKELGVGLDLVSGTGGDNRVTEADVENFHQQGEQQTVGVGGGGGNAVNTMNDVITQVVEGTRLAEEAGDRMKDTRNVTVKLVEYVHDIADKAMKQVKLGQILKERATVIQQSTEKTHIQLQAQSQLSEGLVNDAETLLEKVRVFRLPA